MILRPRTRIRIVSACPYKPIVGDTGRIEKYVPFGKYYVRLQTHGRMLVADDCVRPATARGRNSSRFGGARRRKRR